MNIKLAGSVLREEKAGFENRIRGGQKSKRSTMGGTDQTGARRIRFVQAVRLREAGGRAKLEKNVSGQATDRAICLVCTVRDKAKCEVRSASPALANGFFPRFSSPHLLGECVRGFPPTFRGCFLATSPTSAGACCHNVVDKASALQGSRGDSAIVLFRVHGTMHIHLNARGQETQIHTVQASGRALLSLG